MSRFNNLRTRYVNDFTRFYVKKCKQDDNYVNMNSKYFAIGKKTDVSNIGNSNCHVNSVAVER